MKLNLALVSGTLVLTVAESGAGAGGRAGDAGGRARAAPTRSQGARPFPGGQRAPSQFLGGKEQRCLYMDHLSVLSRQM